MIGTRHSLLKLVTLITLALLIPALLLRLAQPEPAEAFPVGDRLDPEVELDRLNNSQADWVIVGNSMANSRIDWRYLEKISGREIRRLAEGGTQSAIWYLLLKQVVAKADKQPQWVTVFFRDTDLTWPEFRTAGVNEDLILALEGPAQPEWQQVLVANKGSGLVAQVTHALEALLPTEHVLKKQRKEVQEAAFTLTQLPGTWPKSLRRLELNERFGLAHLRHDLGSDSQTAAKPGGGASPALEHTDVPDPGMYENGPVDFNASPDASFLPHMLALAREHGFKLHFHRVKRRPLANHTRPDSSQISRYLADLRTYLNSNDAVLTDESQDNSLTLDMYADGDHISSEDAIQHRYADNFWARVKDIIGPKPAPVP